MVVGYSLGNKDSELDIPVLGEEDKDVITFSKSMSSVLSRRCRNNCPYCAFHRHDGLVVPYSTIKAAKKARSLGVREVLLASGERPDIFPDIRALLDLWGFSSFVDYLYTVSELGFLEGLVPVLEVGFLSPLEMKRMKEICGLMRIMLDTVDDKHYSTVYPQSKGKQRDVRFKLLEWAGRLDFPVITGLLVGIGETKAHRKENLKLISKYHQKYNHIHEVTIQNFVSEPGTPFSSKDGPNNKVILDTVEMALNILPDDILVNFPVLFNSNVKDFIKLGVRDFGSIHQGVNPLFPNHEPVDIDALAQTIETIGFRLQQRFPLKFSYVKEGRYSSKLGQVFDAYRYRIKKSEQDKLKELKELKSV